MSQMLKYILLFYLFLLIYSNDSSNDPLKCYSDSFLSDDFKKNYKLKEIIDDGPVRRATNAIKEEFLRFLSSMYDYETEVDDHLYDLIESIDQECFDFVLKLFFNETGFLKDISQKLLHDGGLIQNSIGTEEDCLNDDGVYILFSGEYNRSELRKGETYETRELLFRESNNVRQEVCIFKQCRHFYKPFIEYLFNYQVEALKILFHWNNFKISGINFKDISDEEKVQKTKEEKEKELEEKNYFFIVIIILSILIIFYFIFSIISWIIEGSDAEISSEIENISNKVNIFDTSKISNISNIPKNEGLIREEEEDEENSNLWKINEDIKSSSTTSRRSSINRKYTDLNLYRIISSFDFIKNFSYLNDKKEPISDLENIIELNTIKIFILFFIMLGENSYIILKYVENKMSILSFCKHFFFFLIKLGMNSYETYKVICGILFGYKFISYYFKYKEKPLWKKIGIFATKPIPYIIMFFIIHFILNYPIFIYVRNLFGDIKNTYLSSIMEQLTCQKDAFQIFNFPLIMSEYNSTEFNIGQFNGCSRPILFTFSELCCFYFVLIIGMINIFLYNKKKVNILYIIFFVLNFIFLSLTYFVTKEVDDLTDEYTVSRLFGLSGTIAMPHLFFPLYYIGFNIGIIYYYKVYFQEGTKENMPFKYCYIISKLKTKISGCCKNIIMSIFLFLIFVLSFSYYLLINIMGEGEFFFTFNDMELSKYIFIYKGILQGIFFSVFILFYLCAGESLFKRILSSEIFNFIHKISFIHFISFISILYFFHSIGIMEIYLLHFSVFSNTVILFIISCLFSIFITCIVFFPIKKIYLYITKGFVSEDYKRKN